MDTLAPRQRLKDSYDQIFAKDIPGVVDAVESKVFGIGAESYTVGSHEFYMCYAMSRPNVLVTFDTGHFHPTEVVSAKLSSMLTFKDKLLLHVSRPVRWDSDHVVAFDDETRAIMDEIVRMERPRPGVYRHRLLRRLHQPDRRLGRGLPQHPQGPAEALLSPVDTMKALERDGDVSARLAYVQEFKAQPFSLVWDYYCQKTGTGVGLGWLDSVKAYEKDVLSGRG